MRQKIFDKSVCLTREQLLNYKTRKLSNEELHTIEKHLIDCPLCSDAVEGIENIDADTMQKDINRINKGIEKRRTKQSKIFYKYSAVAALILITLTVILNISQSSAGKKLFDKYFKVYPDITMHKRGENNGGNLNEAMNFYNLKEFNKAVLLFNKLSPEQTDETAVFYKAVSLIALHKPKPALELLLPISKNRDSKFFEEANWYSALCYSYLDQTDKAGNHLKKLVNSPDYSKQALSILGIIEAEK